MNMINYNMRCIETLLRQGHGGMQLDKLQHEMYWNSAYDGISYARYVDKLQHEMYWNSDRVLSWQRGEMINYNMRCIETCKTGEEIL